MKKCTLYVFIALLIFCYSIIYASEVIGQDVQIGDDGIIRTPPVVLKSAKPYFPQRARMDHVEGIVVLRFLVTKDGSVENPEVLESIPPNYFEDAALSALKKFKFKPATENGVPVDSTASLSFILTFFGTSFDEDAATSLETYRHAYKGKSLIEKAEYQKAVEEMSEAIKLHSEYTTTYYYRSLALMKMEEYEKAILDIDTAIELEGKVYSYYNHRGLIYLLMGDYQKAIEDFDKSIQLETKNLMAYIHRGDAYRESKKYQEAIKDYTKALALDATLIHVNNNRGITYYKLKDYHNACRDFEKACKLGDCRAFERLKNKGVCASEGSGSGE